MKTATISHTKNNLSALIDRVRRGESILILDREMPVAQLVPVSAVGTGADAERIARLERAGLVKRGTGKVVRSILDEPPPKLGKGADILKALLTEREENW